jgi:phosphate starvation-inducible membrane PsiE
VDVVVDIVVVVDVIVDIVVIVIVGVVNKMGVVTFDGTDRMVIYFVIFEFVFLFGL